MTFRTGQSGLSSAAELIPPAGLESILISLFAFETPKEYPHLILGPGLGDRRVKILARILSSVEQLRGNITQRQSLEPCAKGLDQCLGKCWAVESFLGGTWIGLSHIVT